MKIGAGVGPISGDPNRLQQVVWNLLSNAVKFTPKGGEVTVRLEQADSLLSISVQDTGQGIAPDFLPHVFDRFSQADATSTRRYGGLGLGLSIVRHIVEMHGGTVKVESEGEGKGATFTVLLPLLAVQMREAETIIREPAAPKPADAPSSKSANLAELRVLVVEDEADARELIAAVLEQFGAETRTAATAAEGLSILQFWHPDVMVSDIGMPNEDGFSLISKVRSLAPEDGGGTPAVALTAYARAQDRLRTLSAGYQVHVPKPVEPDELAAAVATLAGRHSEKLPPAEANQP
jgi:CheY-like chemotaxis protein